jgi:hypothetical protein
MRDCGIGNCKEFILSVDIVEHDGLRHIHDLEHGFLLAITSEVLLPNLDVHRLCQFRSNLDTPAFGSLALRLFFEVQEFEGVGLEVGQFAV